MKQLTVRSVDEELHAALKQEAQRRGVSINRYVLQVLTEAAGLEIASMRPRVYHDLDHLAGTWTPEQASEFTQFLDEQRQVDEELWV
jgi:plasmid stability protein